MKIIVFAQDFYLILSSSRPRHSTLQRNSMAAVGSVSTSCISPPTRSECVQSSFCSFEQTFTLPETNKLDFYIHRTVVNETHTSYFVLFLHQQFCPFGILCLLNYFTICSFHGMAASYGLRCWMKCLGCGNVCGVRWVELWNFWIESYTKCYRVKNKFFLWFSNIFL